MTKKSIITTRDVEIETISILYSVDQVAGTTWKALKECDYKTYNHLQNLFLIGIDELYPKLKESDKGLYNRMETYISKWKSLGLIEVVTKLNQNQL
jgi:hypothetical protein